MGFCARLMWVFCLLLAVSQASCSGQPINVDRETGAPVGRANRKPGDGTAQWIRVVRDKEGVPQFLQTAVVRYEPQTVSASHDRLLSVDLIGAVHIGDQSYYDRLNKRFEGYDALLFELVAPPGNKITSGQDVTHRHPVGMVQNVLKNVLELEHQLGAIDYNKENFVHADMSPSQFSQSMSARGESLTEMFFEMLSQALAQESRQRARGKMADLDILMALFDPNRAVRLKQVLADQFEDFGPLLSGLGGPHGSTLIEGRNEVALKVLAEEMAQGKQNLGLFYGAGHLADMDKRLRRDFGLRPVAIQWLTAWDMKTP